MKHIGSTSEYIPERDALLYSEIMRIAGSTPLLTQQECISRAIMRPAPRFWISEIRAAEIIYVYLRRKNRSFPNTGKGRMYSELLRRTEEALKENPERTISSIACEIVNQPAPEYYLSVFTASDIYRKQRRLQRELMAAQRRRNPLRRKQKPSRPNFQKPQIPNQ